MMGDLTDIELGAAEELLSTMERANERAFVDPNWLHAARLLNRMATEIRRSRALIVPSETSAEQLAGREVLSVDAGGAVHDLRSKAGA